MVLKRKTKSARLESAIGRATAAYLRALKALDSTAAALLKSLETKTTAKAMILRERRELAVHVARARGVDVDGKRDPITRTKDREPPHTKTGLLIDISNVPQELREKIIARQLAENLEVAN